LSDNFPFYAKKGPYCHIFVYPKNLKKNIKKDILIILNLQSKIINKCKVRQNFAFYARPQSDRFISLPRKNTMKAAKSRVDCGKGLSCSTDMRIDIWSSLSRLVNTPDKVPNQSRVRDVFDNPEYKNDFTIDCK